jgi:hypothetical protein
MKQPEYTDGPKALENFERGMTALSKVPKADIVQPRKPFFCAETDEARFGLD